MCSRMTVSIKWLGHASFLIRAEGKVVYVDPYEGEYTEKADLILITHSHSDHYDASKIGKVCKANTVVVAPFLLNLSCVDKTRGAVKLVKSGEELTVGNVSVEAVEAYNVRRFKSPGNPFHPKWSGVGYLIRAE